MLFCQSSWLDGKLHEVKTWILFIIESQYQETGGLPKWCSGKEPACQCRRQKRNGFDPCIGKIPWRRKWQPTPGISSLGNPLNSLPGYSSGGSQRVEHDWASKNKHMTPRDWHMPGVFFIFVEWRSEWQPKSCFTTRTQLRTIVVCQWIGLLFKAVNFPKPEIVQVERGWLL